MDSLIAVFKENAVSDHEIAYLAQRLSRSGEVLAHEVAHIADVASTGGPSSLSTLLCPLQLVRNGAWVPKLGVPGRPAGGIDVLACIPGFKSHLTKDEVLECLHTCGYAHFLADDTFVPLDVVLFNYRKRTKAIDVPNLAIASLLAKKLAMGISRVALDVRVAPYTNFGSTWLEARVNAQRFIGTAALLGIDATCFLTDAAVPYQPFIGRGESLVALHHILSGNLTPALTKHLNLCRTISNACAGGNDADPSDLRAVFADHLKQQGSSWDIFVRKVDELLTQPRGIIFAKSDGYLSVDLASIRQIIINHQAERLGKSDTQFPDSCGLTLLLPAGTAVEGGVPVASVRSTGNLEQLLAELHRFVFQSATQRGERATEMVDANG
jgi:thymidine phosphorylase